VKFGRGKGTGEGEWSTREGGDKGGKQSSWQGTIQEFSSISQYPRKIIGPGFKLEKKMGGAGSRADRGNSRRRPEAPSQRAEEVWMNHPLAKKR